MNLLAAAEDADEWLALIERLNALRRWKFSEPDSLEKLRACRSELRRFLVPNAELRGAKPIGEASRSNDVLDGGN